MTIKTIPTIKAPDLHLVIKDSITGKISAVKSPDFYQKIQEPLTEDLTNIQFAAYNLAIEALPSEYAEKLGIREKMAPKDI